MRLFVMLMAIAAVSFTFTSCDDDPWDDDYWDDPKMVEKLADQMQQYPVDILNFRYKKYKK